jgi:twitching motility protein PilJ
MPFAAVLKLLRPGRRAATASRLSSTGDAEGAQGPSSGAGTAVSSSPALQVTSPRAQKLVLGLLGLSLVVLAASAVGVVRQSDEVAHQLTAVGQSLMQSQRLAKASSQALLGRSEAFQALRDGAGQLAQAMRQLSEGDPALGLSPAGSALADRLQPLRPLAERTHRQAELILAQEAILMQAGRALRTINRHSADLLEAAETVAALTRQPGAASSQIASAHQLVMLTQRIGKSASELLSEEGVSPAAVFQLGKDLATFHQLGQGLLDGSPELRLPAIREAGHREALQSLMRQHDALRADADAVLGQLQGLVLARQAQAAIVADSEPLRQGLQGLQDHLSPQAGLGWAGWLLLAGSGLAALLSAAGLVQLQLRDSRSRQRWADAQRLAAEREEQEARRINDANQAAILRLMDELRAVSEGDLTQQATVTEDITGAIADSINYTVEELRSLVARVQQGADRLSHTTVQMEGTSTELLAASAEQVREIRDTGRSVLEMVEGIQQVSGRAQQVAEVARQSRTAAASGLSAVQDAMTAMHALRDQIQETAKRIKRLGESSQEIGEITELIADITEQTHVLALNAAIQAASAGEAGRGFSVVAEEVQRLAERSAEATRQIAQLVKGIQGDTQEAVAAMERSTAGVVDGARRSDTAGTALAEIDRVSRRLAELIEEIARTADREAEVAHRVAGNIEHILAVTEQTGEGTRSTAALVRELARVADELRQAVTRFTIA